LEQQTAKQALDSIAGCPFELAHDRQGLGGIGQIGLRPAVGMRGGD
jgi:hypothetical protein